jgi:hypothetical protein
MSQRKRTNVTVSIKPEVRDYFADKFSSAHAGIRELLELYPDMRDLAEQYVGQLFLEDELIVLRNAEKHTSPGENSTSQRVHVALVADECERANHSDGFVNDLMTKVDELSPFHRMVLRQRLVESLHD